MIDEAPIPPFERITESLNHAGSLSDPSEAHGLLCGLLCADNALGSDVWLKQIMSSAVEGRVLAREDRDTLLELFASTSRQLDELAYTEIIEYVRIGVLLVNEILQPHSAPTRPPRLH